MTKLTKANVVCVRRIKRNKNRKRRQVIMNLQEWARKEVGIACERERKDKQIVKNS